MSARAQSPSRAYYATAVALSVLALIGHAVYLRRSGSADLEMFAYMGKLTAAGGRVGIDLIDNKFPTVGLLMSVPYRLLGAHWLGYGVLSLLATNLAALILARGARHHAGAAAYWPTLVAAAVWGNFFLCIFSIFQLEHLQLLLCSLAGVAALNALRDEDWRDALVVGLCAGLAAWCKPTALAVVSAFAATVFFRGSTRPIKLITAACIGVLIPTAAAALCLQLSGTLSLMPAIARQISQYASHSAWDVAEITSKLFDLLLLFALPFVARIFLKFRGDVACSDRILTSSQSRERKFYFLCFWLVLEFFGGFLQGRMLPYYFLPMAAPAALLFGRIGRAPRTLPLLAGFAPPLAIACIGVTILWANTGGVDDKQRIIDYLAANHIAGESVWVDDYPRLAVESDWQPASRLPLINLLTNDDDAPTHFGELLLRDLAHHRPQFLVLCSDEAKYIDYFTRVQEDVHSSPIRQTRMTAAIRSLYDYATANYRPTTGLGRYTVWTRREASSATLASVTEGQP